MTLSLANSSIHPLCDPSIWWTISWWAGCFSFQLLPRWMGREWCVSFIITFDVLCCCAITLLTSWCIRQMRGGLPMNGSYTIQHTFSPLARRTGCSGWWRNHKSGNRNRVETQLIKVNSLNRRGGVGRGGWKSYIFCRTLLLLLLLRLVLKWNFTRYFYEHWMTEWLTDWWSGVIQCRQLERVKGHLPFL